MRFLLFIIFNLPLTLGAAELTNPYMIPIIVDMESCIQANMKDCLNAICMASSDCTAQCHSNSRNKCEMMAGQHI